MTNTTNTTKKTNGKIKRTFTAILAAVMMMSTAATFAASAADTQAVVNMNTSSAMAASGNSFAVVELDNDLLKVKDVTSATLFKVFEEFTEYGKFFTPALSGILDMFIGGQPDPTQEKLDQINDKIDKLFDRIDKLQDELANSLGNQLGIQSFYETFVSFKSQVQSMRRKINEISKDNSLTKLDKIAKIGSLAGTYSEWDIKFENVLGQLNELIKKPFFTQDGNIFDVTYKHFCSQSMFSGEAIDKAKPLCDSLMQVYIAGVTTITECLSAQYYVTQIPKEYRDQISSEYKSHICLNGNDIEAEIKNIFDFVDAKSDKKQTVLVGYIGDDGKRYPPDSTVTEQKTTFLGQEVTIMYINGVRVYKDLREVTVVRSDTIKGMYESAFNKSRRILVNKSSNGNGYMVADTLYYANHGDNRNCDGKYWSNMSELTQNWFNNKAGNNQISFDDIRAMGNYCRSKGISIRTLLNSVGINTSAVPQNTNLVTSKAIDGSTSIAQDIFTQCYYQKTYYKGINIDAVGATEQQYQLLDCGWNLWKGGEQWNYAPGGAFCWLTK